jgi:hypothetical protein
MESEGGGGGEDDGRDAKQQRIHVVMVTNWRLDVVQGRIYGVCFVDAPPEFKENSFRRGFPFINPTHIRCAIFSVMLGMEQVMCSAELSGGRFFTSIVTRSKFAASTISGKESAITRSWANDVGKKPNVRAGYAKQFMKDVFRVFDRMREMNLGDVVYVGSEKMGENGSKNLSSNNNILAEHTVHLDIDPELDYKDKDVSERRAGDTKQRFALKQELVSSGARGTRRVVKLSKKQRQHIARNEGHPQDDPKGKKKKEKRPKIYKRNDATIADRAIVGADLSDATANIVGSNDNVGITSIETANHDDGSTTTHRGLAAAIATEELRVLRESNRERAEISDVGGNVQDEKYRIDGGGGSPEEGIGKHEAAIDDGAEFIQ